jgi:ATP-dependent helicase HrpB
MQWQAASRLPFLIGSPAAAMRVGSIGLLQAGAAYGSIPRIRLRDRNGLRLPICRASRPARASSPPPASTPLRSKRFEPTTGSVKTLADRRLGAIILSRAENAAVPAAAISAALVEGVRNHGLGALVWPDTARALQARAAWAGIAVLSDDALLEALDLWLPPLVAAKRRLSDIAEDAVHTALWTLLSWEDQQRLNTLAPVHFRSPAGTTHAIDYAAPAGPTITLRVQALFGVAAHPVIGRDRTPLLLSLTSPAGRPIQTTRDLPGFWAGSWHAVAKEMRGRYPRHHWPADPIAADASLKTKRALAKKDA